MKDFYGLFSAVSFLKGHKVAHAFRTEPFFIEFLKSTKFVTDLIFSGSEVHFWEPSVFGLLSPKAAVLWLCPNRFCFLRFTYGDRFSHKTRILIIQCLKKIY